MAGSWAVVLNPGCQSGTGKQRNRRRNEKMWITSALPRHHLEHEQTGRRLWPWIQCILGTPRIETYAHVVCYDHCRQGASLLFCQVISTRPVCLEIEYTSVGWSDFSTALHQYGQPPGTTDAEMERTPSSIAVYSSCPCHNSVTSTFLVCSMSATCYWRNSPRMCKQKRQKALREGSNHGPPPIFSPQTASS